MTYKLADRVKETTSAPGTSTATLSGAATGYQSFSAGIGANNTTCYVIADQTGANWEVGIGTVGSGGTTLVRTTVLSSSNSGSLVNFASGTQDVWVDYPAGKAVYKDASNNVTGYAISGGTIDNTPIGATTASTGAFTYASTSSTTSTTPVLSFNGSNTNLASGATVSSSYLQNILQNKSGTAGASTNYVLSNDLGTDSSYYGEFGMNSSVYSSGTPADFFSLNNGVYFSGHDGDITVGSGNGYKTYLAWGTTGDKAHVINASGALGLNTNITGTTNFGTSGQVLTSAGSSATPTWSSTISPSQVLINQSYDQGTGVLQVTGQSTFNGVVVDKSLNLQGGNNLLTYSQLFSNAAWTKTNSSISGTLVTAPDGTTTGSKLVEDTATSTHILLQTITTSATSYTFSVYAKQAERNWVCLNGFDFGVGSNRTWFNLATGVVGTTASGTTASITSVGNGWYRCSITRTFISSASNQVQVNLANADNSASYTGDGTSGTYIWGAQLELGTVASAYTPTTTTAVTTTNNISVPSGQVLLSTGSLFNPSWGFVGNTNTGFYSLGNGAMSIASNNTFANSISFNYEFGGQIKLPSNGGLSWSSAANITSATDLSLYRDSANTLAQRNSTNAQTFRLYNTYTDASNYERLSIDWSTTANTATIVTQNAGTGSARNLAIGQDLYVNSVRVGLGGGAVSSNTAVGSGVLTATATGTNNTGGGFNSLNRISSGASNTSWGANCLYATTTGIGNSSYGVYSLYYNNSGSYNTSSGVNALFQNTTASNLTAVGAAALQNNTTNVATLGSITGGTSYTNGTYTGVVMTLSSGSTAITYPTATIVVAGGVVTTVTLTSNGVGFKDTTTVLTAPATSIGGTGSGFSVPVATLASGTGNVAVGYQAGYTNSVGSFSTLVGYQAGYSGTTGGYMSAFGYQAGYSNTTGSITAFGWSSCQANTTGINNSGFGFRALQSVTTTNFSSAFGDYALQNATGGSNSAYGKSALQSNTSGANNTAIGAFAGYNGSNSNTTGSYNTYLGAYTVGSGVANTNEMAIGYGAVGLGSNTTVIGNSSTTLTKAFGVIVGTNYTVATLPSASTSGVGARAFVTDALAPSFGVAVTGGGAVPIPVYSTGSAWNVG